jgi:PKD domain/RTX calcium-binding nonapeptide repeat (4 copies)
MPSTHPSRCSHSATMRPARARLFLELLEDRTVPSDGEWLLRLDGLAGTTIPQQMTEAQALIDAANIQNLEIEVVDHTGLDGNIVIEVPETVSQGVLTYDLQVLPGFIGVQPFEDEAEAESADLLQFPDGSGPLSLEPSPTPGANLNVGLVGNEPTIAVNPFNSNNVVVAQFNNGAQTMKISLDGGATFPISRNAVLPAGQTFFAGDDSLAFDAAGRLFWTYLTGPGTINVVSLQINPTTGAVIGTPSFVATGNLDKEWLAADKFPTSPFANNLYSVWNDFNQLNAPVRFSRSTDQGLTWTTISGNLSGAGEGFTWPAEVTVAPNGEVWAAWHTNTIGNGSNGEIRMRRSTDGGLTFGPEIIPFPAGTADAQVNAGSAEYGPPVPPRINKLKSWLQGSLQPRILIDPARPGNMYVISVDDPDNVYDAAGDPSDIVMARSTDNGATWTQSTISHGAPGTIQIMPAAAIGGSGNIVVTWYDTRGGATNAAGDYLLDVYTTSSLDGGLTFSADTRINDLSFDPDLGAPDRFPPNQVLRIGEYNGLALAGGNAHAVWTGNTATGQQIVFTKFALGFQVVASAPAQGQVVNTAPNDFLIQLASAVNPASVQASDLTVNGIPADSFAINAAGTTITFHYNTSPVTVPGLQNMAIAAGAITDTSGSPLRAFSATFRYDPVPLAVTTTAPPFPGGIFTLPGPFTYDVNFNEAFDPASLQTTDLVLSGIAGVAVTGVTALNGNTTARFTISGVTIEGTLNASIAAGALTDGFGNPNLAFSAAYSVDYGIVPYPTPLTSKNPLGSFIYDPSFTATINFTGDTDTFTLNIDPGQTITVLVDPAGSPDPTLYGGVGNGSGAAAGQLLLIDQTTAASTVLGDPVTPGGLTGLVYDPFASVLFGSTINGGVSTLVRINPDTGALISTVGTITNGPGGPTLSIGDLAIQPGTNTLFGIGSNAGGAGGLLFTIDKTTGVATLVGSTGSGAGGGIAFAPDGSLYQTAFNSSFDFTSLNKLNPANAARISTVPLPTYFDGLAIRPTDGAFFAAQGGTGTTIYTINPSTGAATAIGNTSSSTSDLAFGPSTALAPTVELRGPSGTLLGSTSAGPGFNALLQTIPTTTGGTYSIAVGGASGTVGGYTVQVILNAALENEGTLPGVSNDTLATAQDLNGSFVTFNPNYPAAQRGAVLGSVQGGGGNLIANGSFETGTFSGWTTATTGSPFVAWTVSTAGATSGFLQPTAPQDGIYDAWNGFDGVGPMEYTMTQDVALPAASGLLLTWKDRLQWDFTLGSGLAAARSYFVEVLNPSTNALLATLYSFSTGPETTNPTGNTGWLSHSANLAAFAGSTVRLRFREVIPETNTGPGQAEFDAIALNAGSSPDWYKFTLGAGEMATLALKDLTGSGSGLSVDVFDGAGNLVPTTSASATNVDRLATFTAASAGTYYARVANTPGSVNYSVVVMKNAAFDAEPNDAFATAQNISGTQGALGSVGGAGATTLTLNATDSGWWDSTGFHSSTNKNYVAGQNTPSQLARDYFVFNLAGVSQTITGAQVRLTNPAGGYVSPDPTETYAVFDVSTPLGALQASGSGQLGIYNDLGTGTNFATRTFSAADNGQLVAIPLNASGVAALDAARGGSVAVGGALTSIAGTATQFVFAFTGAPSDVKQLVLNLGSPEDWYAISVTGLGSTLRLETTTPAGGAGEFVNALNPRIELYNPSGVLVASGIALGDGRNEFIQYAPLVTGTYRVRVTGEGGTAGEYFLSSNFSPALTTLAVTSPVNENGTATLTGTFSDPEGLDTHTVVINWGPGEGTTTLNLGVGVTSFNAQHPYLDDNPTGTASDIYPISVTVTDNHGASGTGSIAVTVNNVAPTITSLSGPTSIDEGATLTLNGTFFDPGTQDTFTLLVNWGEGATQTYLLPAGATSFSISHQYLDDNPSGTASDVYPISLTLTDDDTGTGTTSTMVTVNNVAPTIMSLTPASSINENDTFTLSGTFHDPGTQDTHTVVIDWGEGTTIITTAGPNPAGTTLNYLGNGDWAFSATHRYLDDNPTGTASDTHAVAVSVTDDDTGTASASTSVTVNNVAPTITSLSGVSSINENDTFTLSGTFFDPGTQDTFTLEVNWGEGPAQTYILAAGTTTFSISHQYLDDNPSGTASDVYPISVTLTDDDTGTASANTSVTVNNVAPTITSLSGASSIDEGDTLTLNGTFFDPGTQDTFSLQVNWGEGPTQTYLLPAGATSFSISHQYLDDNPSGTASDVYPISVTLTDDDTGAASASASVTVNNVAPTITGLTGASSIDEGGTLTLSGTFHDPGTQDTHTVVIDWAEGTTTLNTGGPNPAGTTLTYLGNGDWAFSATHRYLDDNPTGTASDTYPVTVAVTDDDTGSNSSATSVVVNNVAPTMAPIVGPAPSPGVRGQSLSFSSTFSDVGILDTHTAVFDWGDGTSSSAVVNEAGGAGSASASHVYAAAGTYTITLTVYDDDLGSQSVTKTIPIYAVALQDDSCIPGTTALAVGGTTGNDTIMLQAAGSGGIEVFINGVSQGVFAPTGRLLVYGQAGDDDLAVAGSIANPAWLFGDSGNDRLKGGAGPNVLEGGTGDDILTGGTGRDLLIGGDGVDQLTGTAGDDILIDGLTAFDDKEDALCAIMAEWTSSRSYADRVANLRGLGSGPRLNGDFFLKSAGPGATVFEDGSADQLTGSSGLDWYFSGLGDVIIDQHSGEQIG